MKTMLFALLSAAIAAGQDTPQRPPIVGLAHVGFFVHDVNEADHFYGGELGFAHFSLPKPNGELMLNYYKVNDRQYIEIYPGLKGDEQDRLSHVAFETPDAKAMRTYLANKGLKVPAALKPGLDGNLSFMVDDPEGRRIEFVQYSPDGLHGRQFGKLMGPARVSEHMIHAGFIVNDRAAEDRFYRDVLGFRVKWYGGMKDDEVRWVDMQVPDGDDWLEYMLGVQKPSVKSRGVQNHMALGVTKMLDAAALVNKNAPDAKHEDPKIGRDGKWQLNLYDPDMTRVELMEFTPVQTPCCSPMTGGSR